MQIRNSFCIAGVVCLVLLLVITWVGILLLADKPNLDPNNLLAYIILNYGYPGLKGLTAIGIMSIIMSSADSYINSAAVLFTNDIFNQLNLKKISSANQLNLSRFFSIFIGIAAFFLAFKSTSILKLLIFILGFYAPIVTGPLLLAIFGFRSTSKTILIGMAAGLATVLMFEFLNITVVDAVIPGMIVNIVTCLSSHSLLRQPGGWVGIKDDSALKAVRLERRKKLQKILLLLKILIF